MIASNQIIIRATQDDVDNSRLAGLPTGTIVVMPNSEVRVVDSTGNANAIQTSGNSPLNNFTATTSPTASNNFSQGYAVGSRWIDITNDESYICTGDGEWSQTTVGTIAEVAGLQAALDGKVGLTGNETIAGTKIFSSPPEILNAATANRHPLRKQEHDLAMTLKQDASTAATDAELSAGLATKANTVHTHVESDVTNLVSDLSLKAPVASPSFTGIPLAPTPTAGTNTTQLATTAYVLDAVTSSQAGLDWKQSARVATTANITLSGVQTIDGIAVVVGNRVLVKDQTTASQNGLYDVAAGAWSRSSDANANNEVSAGMAVYVDEGTMLATSVWTLVTAGNITLGTTALTFSRLFNTSGLQQTSQKDVANGYAGLDGSARVALAELANGLSSTNPVMNGTVAVGTGTTFARTDHVHPSDTTRAPAWNATTTEVITGRKINGSDVYARFASGTSGASATDLFLFTPSTGAASRLIGFDGWINRSGAGQRQPLITVVPDSAFGHASPVYQNSTSGAINMYIVNTSYNSQLFEIVVYYTK